MSRIYETDSYRKELNTRVKTAGTDDKGRHWVELEDTILFPEEGGQNADTGVLIPMPGVPGHQVKVLDGRISGRNTCSMVSDSDVITIRYFVDAPIPEGTPVTCRLDWDVRFDRMQNHSGEHIISGIMHKKFGVDNVGFHLSDTGPVTIDVNRPLTYEQVMEAQNEANRVVYADMPIRVSFPTREELEKLEYRSKIDIEGQVRLITIGNEDETVDICACCAPHVAHTGEIGIVKVLSVINWKGGSRIFMLAGRRALDHINREHDILTEVARNLSTEAVNVPAMVESYRSEALDLKAKMAGLKEKMIIDSLEGMGDEGRYVFTEGDFPLGSMKVIYNALAERYYGFVGIFAGNNEDGYRYNVGSRDRDSRELVTLMKEKLGANGGGSHDMIQGKVKATREEILKVLRGRNLS